MELVGWGDGFRRLGCDAPPRNHWSAIKTDRSGVVLTVWDDAIDRSAEPWTWSTFEDPASAPWRRLPGHAVRREHLALAVSRFGGRVDLLFCYPVDPGAFPREVASAFLVDGVDGSIATEHWDPDSGDFKLAINGTWRT